MKLEPAQAAVLVEVLSAQVELARTGKSPIDKDVYKTKVAEVAQFLNTENGKATGGITKETFADNKDNAELVAAAKAHVEVAKERAEKAAAKADKAKAEPKDKTRTPEQEKESAEAIVAYLNAVSGGPRVMKDGKDDPDGFRRAANKSRKYVNFKDGGLIGPSDLSKEDKAKFAAEGKKTPWERFGKFPGVEEAAKAHKAHLKNKAKEAPADMA